MEETGRETLRLHVLVERLIAVKARLDELDADPSPVHAHPPASFDVLARVRRAFELRGLAMPRDYERVLRAHDGVDDLWRSPAGPLSLLGHRALLARSAPVVGDAAGGFVFAAGGVEAVALVRGPTELPAVVMCGLGGHAVARFPSVTAWLEALFDRGADELTRREHERRRARTSAPPPVGGATGAGSNGGSGGAGQATTPAHAASPQRDARRTGR